MVERREARDERRGARGEIREARDEKRETRGAKRMGTEFNPVPILLVNRQGADRSIRPLSFFTFLAS